MSVSGGGAAANEARRVACGVWCESYRQAHAAMRRTSCLAESRESERTRSWMVSSALALACARLSRRSSTGTGDASGVCFT